MCLNPKSYACVTDTGRQEVKSKSQMQNGFTGDIIKWSASGEKLVGSGCKIDSDSMNNLLQTRGEKLQVPPPGWLPFHITGPTRDRYTIEPSPKGFVIFGLSCPRLSRLAASTWRELDKGYIPN